MPPCFLPFMISVSFHSNAFLPSSLGFPGSSVSKESAYSAGNPGSIPGSGRSTGEGKGKSLQYSCLENPKDRGAWWDIVHGIARVGHDLATKPPPPMIPSIPFLLDSHQFPNL